MRKIWTIVSLGVATMVATPAAAQATRTWVSGVGDDVNPCSRTAPCRTFAGAISKTAGGGEINLLDPLSAGTVTITKSITLRADHVLTGVTASGVNAIIVNGTGIKVVLEGLDLDGLGTGLSGVRVIQAGEVVILDTRIRGFTTAGVEVNSTNKTVVTIADTQIVGNTVGVIVNSADGLSSLRAVNSTFAGNANSSISVNGAGNTALLSNNKLFDRVKGLELLAGGTATSSGNNTIGTPTSDTPTTVMPQG